MTDPGPRPPPLHPDAPATDWIPLVAASVGLAVFLGTAIMATVLLVVRGLVASGPGQPTPDPFGAAGTTLLLGVGLAVAVAFATTWGALRPIGSPYRQGGLAMVAAVATLVLGFLAAPIHYYLGPPGVAAMAAVAAAAAWGCFHRWRRILASGP